MTQPEFAAYSGVSVRIISAAENGEHVGERRSLPRILTALDRAEAAQQIEHEQGDGRRINLTVEGEGVTITVTVDASATIDLDDLKRRVLAEHHRLTGNDA
jgi:transcriptional regulator with XRE-family HTH domain